MALTPPLTVVYNQLVNIRLPMMHPRRPECKGHCQKGGVCSTCLCLIESNVAFHRKLGRRAIWHRERGPCTPLGEDGTEVGRAILGQNKGKNQKKKLASAYQKEVVRHGLFTHEL